ncbi:MAG TPA: hypothetical protein ENF95_00760, partial [Candidatus Aenigmarchaeota archaeon]|nr:hypothetical protein [Candidatus Aenigmarchaeota archaeon]
MKEEKNVMKTYTLVADNVKAKVKIYREKEDYVSRYEVTYPKIEEATSVILGSIKEELIHSLGIKASEILDPNVIEKVKKESLEKSEELIKKYIPHLSPEKR